MKPLLPKKSDKLPSPIIHPTNEIEMCLPVLVNNYAKEEHLMKPTLLSTQKRHIDAPKSDIGKGASDFANEMELKKRQLPALLSIKDRISIVISTKPNDIRLFKSDSVGCKIGISPKRIPNNQLNASRNLKSNHCVIHSILNEILTPTEKVIRKPSREYHNTPIDEERVLPKVKYLKPLKQIEAKKIVTPFAIDGKNMVYEISGFEGEYSKEKNISNEPREAVLEEMFRTHDKLMNEPAKEKKEDSMVFTLTLEDNSSGSGSSHTFIDKSKLDTTVMNTLKRKEDDDSIQECIVDDDEESKKNNESSFCSKIIDSSALDEKRIS